MGLGSRCQEATIIWSIGKAREAAQGFDYPGVVSRASSL